MGRCRRIVQSRGRVLKKLNVGSNPQDGGWLSEPIWCRLRVGTWPPWTWSRLRRRLDGTGATWYTSWILPCSALVSPQIGTALMCHSGLRNVRNFRSPLRSLMQDLQSVTTKKKHKSFQYTLHPGRNSNGFVGRFEFECWPAGNILNSQIRNFPARLEVHRRFGDFLPPRWLWQQFATQTRVVFGWCRKLFENCSVFILFFDAQSSC